MRKALIIGLQNYMDSPLKGYTNDAKNISRLLTSNEDASVDFGCKLLTDDEEMIDRRQLKRDITDLFNADGYEAVLLYFSGHGYLDISGGFIVPSDAREPYDGVSMDEILILANQSKALNKIIILDCCNAGAFGNPQIDNGNATRIGKGITILSASTRNQLAIQERGQGIFTSLLIEALEGVAADLCGNITAGNIYSFIDNLMGPWGQRPGLKTNIDTFIPIRKVKPPIPLEVLKKLTIYFAKADQEYPLDPSYEGAAPEAIPEHTAIFKDLLKLVSIGVVKPVGEEHMYFAALNSKSCKLTTLGQVYWRFVKEGRI